MPVRFLSDAERDRLSRFPQDMPSQDINKYFQLTEEEQEIAESQRGEHNRLGFALQLGCLRYLGFFPTNLFEVPPPVVEYVAQQLSVDPNTLNKYGRRANTPYDHQRQIQTLLGYRHATADDAVELQQWLVEAFI